MNKAEARRAAHGAVASLIAVNLEAGAGDLYAGLEDYEEADTARIGDALEALLEYHQRRAHP